MQETHSETSGASPRADSGVSVATVSACVGRSAQAIQDAQTLLALLTDKMMEPRQQVGASVVGAVQATQESYTEVAAHTRLPLTLHRLCIQVVSQHCVGFVFTWQGHRALEEALLEAETHVQDSMLSHAAPLISRGSYDV